jgi:hypothetical protein
VRELPPSDDEFEYNSEDGPKLDKFGNAVVEDEDKDEGGRRRCRRRIRTLITVMLMMMELTSKTTEYDIANRSLGGLTFRWGVSRTLNEIR